MGSPLALCSYPLLLLFLTLHCGAWAAPTSPTTGFGSLGPLQSHAYGTRPEKFESFPVGPSEEKIPSGPTSGHPPRSRGLHKVPLHPPSNPAHAPLTHLSFTGLDVSGGRVDFASSSLVRPDVVSLDALPFVLSLTCATPGVLTLAASGFGGESAALGWTPGTIIVGGAHWGCGEESGPKAPLSSSSKAEASPPMPFYFRVAAPGPVTRSKRGSFLFHGSMDVAAIDFPVEPVQLSEVFHHLTFSMSRLGAGTPTSSSGDEVEEESEKAEEEGGDSPSPSSGRTTRQQRRLQGGNIHTTSSASPYLPLRWGFPQSTRKEAAVNWNVLNNSAGAPLGPLVEMPLVTMHAPLGGHLVACSQCYMWAAVDVYVSGTFADGVAQELEVSATLRSTARFQFDAQINGTVKPTIASIPINRTYINPVDGKTVWGIFYNDTDLGVFDTGKWSVPLVGQGAGNDWLGGIPDPAGAPAKVLLNTLYFSVQGVPMAVPVSLAMTLNFTASWNNTATPATVASLTNAGMSVSGSAMVGSRYTMDAGWHATRGARALAVSPFLPYYDIPALTLYTLPDATPIYSPLSLGVSLEGEITTTLFSALDFTSRTSAYTRLRASPGCGPSYNYSGFTFGPPISITPNRKNVFASIAKGLLASATVGDPSFITLQTGPACGLSGCSGAEPLVQGLHFPNPPTGIPTLFPFTLGPLSILRDETLPVTAYSSGCIPNFKAISTLLWNTTTRCLSPGVKCMYEVDDFEKDPAANSVSCGRFDPPAGSFGPVSGYKYRTLRCRGTVSDGSTFLAPVAVCDAYAVHPDGSIGQKTKQFDPYIPYKPSLLPPCGTMQVFPGSMYDNAPAGSGCENQNFVRQTNGSFVNFTVPLFGLPECRWVPQFGQWGRAYCDPTGSSPNVNVQVCYESTCTYCSSVGSFPSSNTNPQLCALVGAPAGILTWPLQPRSSARATCGFASNAWPTGTHMPLDGGITAASPPSSAQYSVSVGAANTVAFIITYMSKSWNPTTPANPPGPKDLYTWVSFRPKCDSGAEYPPTIPSCAALSSLNPVETSLAGGSHESPCPLEFVQSEWTSQFGSDKSHGCLMRVITVPLSQSSSALYAPIEFDSRSRAYLSINYLLSVGSLYVTIQGIAWTRASSSEPLTVVHSVPPMDHLFYSYRPGPGIYGMALIVTQLSAAVNGKMPRAHLLARSYEVGLRPAWPRRWEAGLDNVLTGLPCVVDPSMLPYTKPGFVSASLCVVRLVSLDLDASPTDTTGQIQAEEQLFTVASTDTAPSDFLVQAFDLVPSYAGVPQTLSLLGGSRVAYVAIPADTGATAMNVTLWLQPGGSASACVSPGVGTFDFTTCTSASLGRRMQQLTIRESQPGWSAAGMTVVVLARSEVTFTITITPFVPLEPGTPASGVLPLSGALVFGGQPDVGPTLVPFDSAAANFYSGGTMPGKPAGIYTDRSSYVANVFSRAQADTGGEVSAYSGSGSNYQRSPPSPSGFEQALKSLPPDVVSHFGGSYLPPHSIPPVLFTVWGSGSAVGSLMGGESGPQPQPGPVGVPWTSKGEDTTNTFTDPAAYPGYPNVGVAAGVSTAAPPPARMMPLTSSSPVFSVEPISPRERKEAVKQARLARTLAASENARLKAWREGMSALLAAAAAAGNGNGTLPLDYTSLLPPRRHIPFTPAPPPGTPSPFELHSSAYDHTSHPPHPNHMALPPLTARSLAQAEGHARSARGLAGFTLTPGLTPITVYSFQRLIWGSQGGSWVEMYTSGAGCSHPTVTPSAGDSYVFYNFGIITCANLSSVPESGLELMVAIPAATALRIQVRPPNPATTRDLPAYARDAIAGGRLSWSLCVEGGLRGPNGAFAGCASPASGPAPWTDVLACNPTNSSAGAGALRYLRVNIAPEWPDFDPSNQILSPDSGRTRTSERSVPGATLVLAAAYAGVDACPTYSWNVAPWGPCNDPCSPSTQTRMVQCVDSKGVVVTSSLCPQPPPAVQQTCNSGPCVLVGGPWGECVAPCRQTPLDNTPNGWQYRNLKCVGSGGTGLVVPDGYCTTELDMYALSSLPCLGPPCAKVPVYINGPWGPCSSPCGGGIQSRSIACGVYYYPSSSDTTYTLVNGDPEGNDPTFVETQWCDAFGLKKDVTVQACNLAPCAAPEVTLTYADVRALTPNASLTQVVVPGGSRRYFSLPLASNRPSGTGICIDFNVEPYSLPAPNVSTCSERAISDLGTCMATLNACLYSAQSFATPNYTTTAGINSFFGMFPGKAAPLDGSIPPTAGVAPPERVCSCYAAAQQCMAFAYCIPAPWQSGSIASAQAYVREACVRSTCGNGTTPLATTSCAINPAPTHRITSSAIHIYGAWQMRGAQGTIQPGLFTPSGSLPRSRATSDIAAVPIGFTTAFPTQGLQIDPREIPPLAYGLVFSVAAPTGGVAGLLQASVLYPDMNLTVASESDLYGSLPPPQPFPIQVTGNLSTGALYNFTKLQLNAPWQGGGGNGRPNVTSLIPSFSWNDTNLLAGGLTLTINLTCGAFVDPDLAYGNLTLGGVQRFANLSGLGKNGLLGGFSAQPFQPNPDIPFNFATLPAVQYGWEAIRPWLLANATLGIVSYTHLSNIAVITLPSLAQTDYNPSGDEVLTLTIPGHLLTSGRDTPVSRFRIRINATLPNTPKDCVVGGWGAWTGCNTVLPSGVYPPPTCGSGLQIRSRPVLIFPSGSGARACPITQQTRTCTTCDPCQNVACYNGGLCIGGVCACGIGYGGPDCAAPPATPIVCQGFSTGPWSSCVDNNAFGWSNRTVGCACYDGSLAIRGLPPSRPIPVFPTPSATPTQVFTGTSSTTPSSSPTLQGATMTSSDTPSQTPSFTPTTTPTLSPNATPSVTPSDSPTTSVTPTQSPSTTLVAGTVSQTPTFTVTDSSSLSPTTTPTLTGSVTNTFSVSPAPGSSLTKTLSATPSPTPNTTFNNFTWAPPGCGTIPVPLWRTTCPLGFINNTGVQMWVGIPSLNHSDLLAHANVWDSWSAAFGAQLADYVRIPRTQLRVIHAGFCPPPPTWLGPTVQSSFYATYAGYSCLTLEFTEDVATRRPPPWGPGLSVIAALYRVAVAIGARGPPGNMGDFYPAPLGTIGGPTPTTYLLQPLWNNPLSDAQVLTLGSWAIVGKQTLPGGLAAPTIIPGAPNPGRTSGRFIDMGGVQANRGIPSPPFQLNALALLFSVIGLGVAIVVSYFVILPWVKFYMTARAPRPYGFLRPKSPRKGSSIPSNPDAWGSRIAAAQRKAERDEARKKAAAEGGDASGRSWFGGGSSSKTIGGGGSSSDGGGGGGGGGGSSGSDGEGTPSLGGASPKKSRFASLVSLNPLNVLAGGGGGPEEGGCGGLKRPLGRGRGRAPEEQGAVTWMVRAWISPTP